MIKTTQMLLEDLSVYADPHGKIARMVDAGEITKVIKGIYETDSHTPAHLLAGSILGPSYISSEYALSAHGLIPEAVRAVTCATFQKQKQKRYSTPFGLFTYRDIPAKAFPYGIEVHAEGDYFYRMANAEKALCDRLYIAPVVNNNREFEALLFSDLRIDEEALGGFDISFTADIAPLYRSRNVERFARFLERI